MPKTESPLKVAFGLFMAVQVLQASLSFVYVLYTYGAITDVGLYGWGHVPMESIQTFIWLSDHLEAWSTALTWAAVPLYFYLVYQTAAVLDRLSIKEHLNAGWTTASMLVPVYSFYRPWAGLAEVANTLTLAVSRGSLPYIGIRGVNTPVVLLAFSTYGFIFAEKMIGIETVQLLKIKIADQASALAYFSKMANLLLLEVLFSAIFIAVVAWFWTRVIRQFHECVTLPNASIELAVEQPSVPARDVLNVGTIA